MIEYFELGSKTGTTARFALPMDEKAGLEVKPGSELERARAARPKNAVRTLRRT